MSLQVSLPASLSDLAEVARINRIDTMDMFAAAGNGHYGSCFSCAEIVTALYFHVMRLDPARPDWPGRDRFVLGKGHAAPTLYSALIRRGFMPENWIHEFEAKVGVKLMTHPSRRYQPGVDASGGALGHGLSLGVGMALAGKMDGADYRTFVLLGDGEIQEGSVWEAFASGAKYRLGHLVAIIDANGLSVDGRTEDVMPMAPEKLHAFGWEVIEVDGHDFPALLAALEIGRDRCDGRPRAIVAHTVKGRGVSFMENVRRWHADILKPEEDVTARAELARPLT
jgi:transketolase